MVWKLGKKFYEKVMTKRRCKKRVVQLCTLTKISSEIGFLSVNWAIPEKRWELSSYFFEKEKKTTGISRFVISPLDVLDKVKLFIPKKSCKIIRYLLGMKWFIIFSLLPLKTLVISCLTPGNSTLYFFNIPGKSKSWNSQFRDFTWTDKLLIMKF